MIGASKILTVSYGTFSCTLEGFDDPFNTMRAIAEYFRDLAAEDRYFGAEPPTPDAAMLHKIAEREVQRRVEAKINENGVVLRTGDAMQAPAVAPQPIPQPAPAPVILAPETPAQSAPMPEGVAAKLLRIRAAVANAELAEPRKDPVAEPAPPAPLVLDADPILTDYSEDQHADDILTSSVLTATFAPDLSDAAKATPEVAPEVGADTEFADAQAAPDAEIIASDSVDDVVQAAEHAAPAAAQTTDLPEDDFADVDLTALLQTKAEPETDVQEIITSDDALLASLFEEKDAPADLDPIDYAVSDAELADLRALDGAAPESYTEADQDYDEDYDDAFENAGASSASSSLDAEFADELAAEAELAALAEAAAEPVTDPVIAQIDEAYGPDTAPTGPSEKALRARARVIKVRRDDADTAPALPQQDAAAETSAAEAAKMAEADLRRDLRALQQQQPSELASGAASDDDTTDTDAAPEDDARQRLDPAGEAAVSRLIEQTNEVMAVPENRRRLSAIAHLKAAVAATVADRFSKGGAAPKEAETKRLDPYREDLARVVRPQHPTAADDAAATPRPAPLVLVSAQRIDRPRATPGDAPVLSAVPNAPPANGAVNPVRPRRVTSAAVAIDPVLEADDEDEAEAQAMFADARGFAEFSERLGANSLAEILEAAAAYSVCVEGRPYFSRPQLMSQIGALSADSDFTREDGLRTFGALLRDGRIQKIKRGQFVLTESSRYLAEARTLAG